MKIGKTVLVGATIFSLVLTLVYFLISLKTANSIPQADMVASNFYYFMISLPQVPLYIIVLVIEAILWGSQPAKASLGFGLFEIAKVVIAFVTVSVFHMGLTGAILAVMGAQVVQLATSSILARKDFGDEVSFSIIATMVRNGWLAMLSSLQSIVLNSDSCDSGSYIVISDTNSSIWCCLHPRFSNFLLWNDRDWVVRRSSFRKRSRVLNSTGSRTAIHISFSDDGR